MIIFLSILAAIFLFIYLVMRQPQFGATAEGERQQRMQRSPNYRNGRFQNLSETPALTDGATMLGVLREFIFSKNKRGAPPSVLPTHKTDLFSLDPSSDVIVWFGHSSYFMQLNGKKILVDPVLSGYASPFAFTTKSFSGSDIYTVNDIPPVDYLFITHDHYDHLDHLTVRRLQSRVGKVITGLGVGAHLERWGYTKHQIIEKDWYEEEQLDQLTVYTTPARHFSGRQFKRNVTLWLSFVLYAPGMRIYIGGDSGYDGHFKKIGEQFGPFDLAILENGQYHQHWKYIHMMPEEVVQAAKDLQAKRLLPVHWSKFSLSLHAWDDSIVRVTLEAEKQGMPVLHPMIGEPLLLNDFRKALRWWEKVM